MQRFLVSSVLLNKLICSGLFPLRVLFKVAIEALFELSDHCARLRFELLLALLDGEIRWLCIIVVFHHLDLLVGSFRDLGHSPSFLLVNRPELFLFLALMGNLLLFELIGDLLESLLYKLIDGSEVPLIATCCIRGLIGHRTGACVIVGAHLHLLEDVTICACGDACATC